LFKQEANRWVFAGPTPSIFEGYDKDHRSLLVDYIFQLTPEEQRRVSSAMGRTQASNGTPVKPSEKKVTRNGQQPMPIRSAGGGGSR